MTDQPRPPHEDATADQLAALFTDLYRENRAKVLWHIRKTLGASGISAEDVAQETWIKVFNKLQEIRTNPRSYILTVASHEAANAHRRTSRLRSLEEEYAALVDEHTQHAALQALDTALEQDAPEDATAAPAGRQDPSDQRKALLARVWAAMEKLSPRQRAVILMWVEGNPPPTDAMIGHRLDIGPKTANTHRHRGVKNLRRILEVEYPPESSSGGAEEGAQR
ncbi:RNA polymerase sigma factor [Actinomadura sp. 1N219]|uniref:RNA polymerase sigma factor n=1 Tax=Actinomadura sp. 1N219 TaxID=3375152 RepID=UPI00378AB999